MNKTRLEAFSDGVIAIIITIMVLELRPPHSSDWIYIKPLIPIFISYILSFVTIGIYWGNHHHLLHTVNHVHGNMIWANLHLLFWLSLIPFATAWMGESNFSRITVAAYAFLLDLCGIAYYILMNVVRQGQRNNEVFMQSYRKQSRKGLISQIAYTLAIPAAFIHVAISGALVVMIGIMWWLPDKSIE